MPSLFLPATMAKKLVSDFQPPEPLKKYRIQGAEGAYITSDKVTTFVQALTVNGFTFGYHILLVHQSIILPFTTSGDSGILHYSLIGGMNIHHQNGAPMLQCVNQHYGLGYHPASSKLTVHFSQGAYHYFQLAFSINLLQKLLQSFPIPALRPLPAYSFFASFLPVNKKVNDLIQLLLMQAYRAVPDVLQLNNYALRLTARFLFDYRSQEKRQHWEQKKETRFAELEAYIDDHLDTDNKIFLSIPVLARKTGTSPYYFKKLFLQQYGSSLAAFIRKKRMETAMQLITGSSLPAGDIYQQVGYEDFSSFTRAFTAYYGHPPTYYRPT